MKSRKILDSIRKTFTGVFKRELVMDNGYTNTSYNPRLGGCPIISTNGAALNVAAVYRCVDMLSSSVANLPLQYMHLKNGIFEEDENSRLHYLLRVQPSGRLSAIDFWRLVVQYMLLEGNAYIVPVYSPVAMDIETLELIDPRYVTIDASGKYTVNDLVSGISGSYDESEIIHIKNYTTDGRQGISILSFARNTIDAALTGDAETLDRFANGGNVRGFVSNDTSVQGFGEYQDEELKKTATDIDGRFRSGERIVSLPGQVDFKPVSLSSADMQFLESRKFTIRDICRFFGVHPSFIFDDTSSNYKFVETANVTLLSHTLNPILRKIEAEFQRKLIPYPLYNKRKFEFDRRGIYACDLESRVKYQAQTIAAGIYTVNEWRRMENKPEVEGGDRVLVSANLKCIDDL